MDLDDAVHKRMQNTKSAFISAHKVTSLENERSSVCVFVEYLNQKFLHGIVAAEIYYGCFLKRFDVIMVETDVSSSKEGNRKIKALI